MRHVLMTVLLLSSLSACAADAADPDPQTGQREQAVSQLIGEKFENFAPGNIDGQFGWVGNCNIVDGADKYVKCAGGANASKEIGLHGAGSYTMLVDLGPNINVENSTHGKIFLEGPPTASNPGGYVFQILIGCDNVRAAFQQSGPTLPLLSFPCHSLTGPPAIRVICNWTTGGTVLSCGAAFKPADPTTYVNLSLPSGLLPFDSVELVSFNLPGASLFDKIYVWQN
jgi:hypothetical protein